MSPDPTATRPVYGEDLQVAVAAVIADDLIADDRTPADTAATVQGHYVAALRALAREWQSSDLMDAAAWMEGTL